jgi:hypothetical protein
VTTIGKMYLNLQTFRPLPFVLANGTMSIIKGYWEYISVEGYKREPGKFINNLFSI